MERKAKINTPVRKAKVDPEPEEELHYVLYCHCLWFPYKDPQCKPLPKDEYKKYVAMLKSWHPEWWEEEKKPWTEAVKV